MNPTGADSRMCVASCVSVKATTVFSICSRYDNEFLHDEKQDVEKSEEEIFSF